MKEGREKQKQMAQILNKYSDGRLKTESYNHFKYKY